MGTFTGNRNPVIEESINGVLHRTYEIVGANVAIADEVSVFIGNYLDWTLVQVESKLDVAGAATTVQPKVGLSAAYVLLGVDDLNLGVVAAAGVRSEVNKKLTLRDTQSLFVRPTPNGVATLMTVRLLLRRGF